MKKIKMSVRYIALVVLCLLVSCVREGDTGYVEYSLKLESSLALDDFIEDVKYIELELTPESFLSDVDRFAVDSNYYYVQSREEIFVFDKFGKYISKVDRKGRSAIEYNSITDYDVHNGRIYVLSNSQRKILVYNIDGGCENTIDLDDWYHNISVNEAGILLYSERANSQKYDVLKLDFDGKVVAEYIPSGAKSGIMYGVSPFMKQSDNSYFLSFPYDRRLWKLSGDKCSVQCGFSVEGGINMSEEDIDSMTYEELKKLLKSDTYLKRIKGYIAEEYAIFALIDVNIKNKGLRSLLVKVNMRTGELDTYLCGEEINQSYPFFSSLLKLEADRLYSVVNASYIHSVTNSMNGTNNELIDLNQNPTLCVYTLRL